jgi:hypothetical protein
MTFSIAKGRSRRPTWNDSDKTPGNPYNRDRDRNVD